ncbi:MAG: aminodeoxychorismate/anthranilate synthase component II [Planctomycetota bacterium]|jgi:anthranilate synthase component 2|nr:aminodeoxychorismate/anthranilate synthase component II [Planctomycetota bacterium]
MILLIDNYDSFTYNLYQSLATAGAQVDVLRNDAISVEAALAAAPAGVVISPGPGNPDSAGICLDLVRALPAETPLLGVCLGHQVLVQALGGTIDRAPVPVHGKSAMVHHDGTCPLFTGLPNPFPAGRYHSLYARREELPSSLRLTAWVEDGTVMAVRHRERPWVGLQFHPESILTPQGDRMLTRFLASTGEGVSAR